jgi:ElaB/YqjD/DUF883 family membrane-anchored ribosome-binding protein
MAHNDNTIPSENARISMEELSELRKNAEAHLDKAQNALFDDNVTDEDALSHLDAALACLNTMISEPETGVESVASVKIA